MGGAPPPKWGPIGVDPRYQESYFSGVVELRTDLFGLWERGRAVLSAADARTMHAALGRVDSFAAWHGRPSKEGEAQLGHWPLVGSCPLIKYGAAESPNLRVKNGEDEGGTVEIKSR